MQTLVDGPALALMLGVKPATIRSYARRGKLTRHGRDGRRALYSLEEAVELLGARRSLRRSRRVS